MQNDIFYYFSKNRRLNHVCFMAFTLLDEIIISAEKKITVKIYCACRNQNYFEYYIKEIKTNID